MPPEPHRATITIEWSPSASVGEAEAVHALLDARCGALMETLLEWGVVDPCVSLDLSGDHVYLSTACHHGNHNACRLTCKWCGSPCACEHHKENPDD